MHRSPRWHTTDPLDLSGVVSQGSPAQTGPDGCRNQIDFSKGDPVEQIQQLRRQTVRSLAQVDPVMMGVMCGIDAVGFEARDLYNPTQNNPTTVIDALCRLVNPTGRLAMVGVYEENDPKAINKELQHGQMTVP